MSRINSKNIISPKVVKAGRIILGIILLINLIYRILYSWNNEIPALLYFTVLTNMLIGIYYIGISIFKKLRKNSITHVLTTYIVIVGSVFVLFLDDGFIKEIYTKLSNSTINSTVHYVSMINSILTHYFMPIIVSLDYLVLTDMRETKINNKILLIFPLVYLAAAMVYGLLTGCYTYPFLDLEFVGGWVILIIVIIALAIVFILTSYFLRKLNCKIQNKIESYYRGIVVSAAIKDKDQVC